MTARFGNLAGREPLGQKAGTPKATKRKTMRRISRKRAAYLASDERKAGKAHMANVAMLHCLVCGAWPVEVHHEGSPRSDMRVLPLCPRHHRREFGPGAYHYSKRAFYDLHGSSDALLARVDQLLAASDDESLASWF